MLKNLLINNFVVNESASKTSHIKIKEKNKTYKRWESAKPVANKYAKDVYNSINEEDAEIIEINDSDEEGSAYDQFEAFDKLSNSKRLNRTKANINRNFRPSTAVKDNKKIR